MSKTIYPNSNGRQTGKKKAWTPDFVRRALAAPLTTSGKIVLIALATYANEIGNNLWPSTETLATETGLSERWVRITLDRLTAEGYLTVVKQHVRPVDGKPGRPTHYRFGPAFVRISDPKSGSEIRNRGSEIRSSDLRSETAEVRSETADLTAPEQTILTNHLNKPMNKGKNGTPQTPLSDVDDEIDQADLDRFEDEDRQVQHMPAGTRSHTAIEYSAETAIDEWNQHIDEWNQRPEVMRGW